MIEQIQRFAIPAAFELLPPIMRSTEAEAMLLAIGLQESRFQHRHQVGGPAVGYWQFEVGGIRGVLEHPRVNVSIAKALRMLGYDHTLDPIAYRAVLEHNDVAAACFARCLLWTHPDSLGDFGEADRAWRIYLETWRPGKPHRAAWSSYYEDAWVRATTAHIG